MYLQGTNKIVDTTNLSVVPKRVRPLWKQHEGESRRLWQHVSESLKTGNMDLASEHKHYVRKFDLLTVRCA